MLYILDTNIFNRLLDEVIHLEQLPSDGQFAASLVQLDEIRKTTDIARRNQLLDKFEEISPKIVPTESFALDVSRLDCDKLSDGHLSNSLKQALDALNRSKRSNVQDVLIAEVAVANELILITTDRPLATVVTEHGGKAIHVAT